MFFSWTTFILLQTLQLLSGSIYWLHVKSQNHIWFYFHCMWKSISTFCLETCNMFFPYLSMFGICPEYVDFLWALSLILLGLGFLCSSGKDPTMTVDYYPVLSLHVIFFLENSLGIPPWKFTLCHIGLFKISFSFHIFSLLISRPPSIHH